MISYTLYFGGPSRNLDERIDAEAAKMKRLEELHKIDYLVGSLTEDLQELLPAGYTIDVSKEVT